MSLTPYVYLVRPVRVIDGDTLELEIDAGFGWKHKEIVRLYGVNTPEIFGQKAQPEGQEAKAFVVDWLAEQPQAHFTLHSVKYNARDKYGRCLGELYNARGESLNQALLDNGLAVAF